MISLFGDWDKCKQVLTQLSRQLRPLCKAKLYEDGNLVVEKMQGHIDKQDLPWKALSEVTVQLKQDEKIYLETGYLRDNIGLIPVASKSNEEAIFIGVSPTQVHPVSGLKYNDIMMYMEYGTLTQPPRPLVRPTFDEVNTKLQKEWKDYFESLLK